MPFFLADTTFAGAFPVSFLAIPGYCQIIIPVSNSCDEPLLSVKTIIMAVSPKHHPGSSPAIFQNNAFMIIVKPFSPGANLTGFFCIKIRYCPCFPASANHRELSCGYFPGSSQKLLPVDNFPRNSFPLQKESLSS